MRILTLCCLTAFLAAVSPLPVSADYQDTVERTFDVSPGGTLMIESDLGSITVATGQAATVAVTVTRRIDSNNKNTVQHILNDLDIAFSQTGADVSIRTEYDRSMIPRWTDLHLTYQVTIPETYNVNLRTSGGSIQVADMEGNAVCRTSGGSITFQNVDGEVEARTSGGGIRLAGVTGNALLHTSGGGITVGNVNGTIDAQTSGGSIHIEHAGGNVLAKTSGGGIEVNEVMGTLDAQTSGGTITAYLSRQPERDCSLITSGGSIHVYLNPDTRLAVNARTSGGGISTDLPLTVTGELSRNRINAVLNGGGPELTVRTSGGSIMLHRKI